MMFPFVTDSDCDKDDWESVLTNRGFDLVEEDEVEDLKNDGDEHNNDSSDDNDSNNMSCNVLMIFFTV